MSRPSAVVDLVAGDGIGPEVTAAAVACVDAVAGRHDVVIEWRERDWGCERLRRHGAMMPVDGLDDLADGDAILLGAVGAPDVPDTVSLWGLLIPIRRAFAQAVNLRPVRSLPGRPGPGGRTGVDLVVVRENVEGEYSEIGGLIGDPRDPMAATQVATFTRAGVARVARYAAELASTRSGRLTSATKSNGILHTMPFWDDVVARTVAEVDGVDVESVLVDALAARMVMRPESLDVVVASNLFGDILSDLAAAVVGSLGAAPSANLDPTGRHPSMFEPVHGSAPDIAGTGVANPLGSIRSAAMMLDHLEQPAAASTLATACDAVLASGLATPDLGGEATTRGFAEAVIDAAIAS